MEYKCGFSIESERSLLFKIKKINNIKIRNNITNSTLIYANCTSVDIYGSNN